MKVSFISFRLSLIHISSGAQKRYEDKIKERKKAEIEAKKAAIRAEDIAKGVFEMCIRDRVQADPAPKGPEKPKDAPRRGKEQIVYIKLNELYAFKNHPFEVRDDEEMVLQSSDSFDNYFKF